MVKTLLHIEGMRCGMCESHVNDVIRRNFQVKKVSSSHSKNSTEVISEAALDEEKLREVIAETGYDLGEITSEPYESKGLLGGLFKKG